MSSQPVRILVIDDEYSIRLSHGMYFQEMGHEVTMVDNAEMGLNTLQTWLPEAALVDYRLPGMQGIEFIRQAHRLYPSVLYLLYTGDAEMDVPPDLKAWGFSKEFIIEKPCLNLESLRLLILKLIQEKR